jgi:hypothetical protein
MGAGVLYPLRLSTSTCGPIAPLPLVSPIDAKAHGPKRPSKTLKKFLLCPVSCVWIEWRMAKKNLRPEP